MSIVNNIQGTMTQTQQTAHLQQQQMDQGKAMQHTGELVNKETVEEKNTTVTSQEDTNFAELGKDGGQKQEQKNKNKKKTLLNKPVEPENLRPLGMGGGLINTQA